MVAGFYVQLDNESKKVGAYTWKTIFTSFIIISMEKNQKKSFWQVVKRFMIPVFENKLIYTRAGFIYFMRSFWSVLNIYFLTQIVKTLEEKTYEMYYNYLVIYMVSFVIYMVITFAFRNYGRSEIMFFTTNKIYP